MAAILAIGVSAAPATAGFPALELRWSVDDVLLYDDLPFGMDNGGGNYRYQGSIFHVGTGLLLEYSIVGKPDPFLSLGITLTNTTENVIEVSVEALLPISPGLTQQTFIDGSAAFGLTADDSGGTLGHVAGTPGWAAFVDGDPVAALHDSLMVSLDGLGSDGVSDAFGPMKGPVEALSDIGIVTTFTLTPGDQMSLTSVFNVVPAPATVLPIAAGLLVAGRRRRRGSTLHAGSGRGP